MIQVKFESEDSNRLVLVWDEPEAPVSHEEDQIAADVLFGLLGQAPVFPPHPMIAAIAEAEAAHVADAADVAPADENTPEVDDAVPGEPVLDDGGDTSHFVISKLVILDSGHPALV